MVPTHPCTVQVAGGAQCLSLSGGNTVCGSDTRDYAHEQTIYSRYLHLHVSRGAALPSLLPVSSQQVSQLQDTTNTCRNLF